MKDNKAASAFIFNFRLDKPTGVETITVAVGYRSPSTTTTSISETINIVK